MRAAEQVLDLYECFADGLAPLALTELARKLGMAPSTCFNLVRTFESRGFLYATGQRRALYPTKRMLALAQQIARRDPVSTTMVQCLTALRDATEETVVLASRLRDQVIYLEVLESGNRIRYSAEVGEMRPMQLNSMGKALISLLPDEEREALVGGFAFAPITPRTLDTKSKYLADVEQSAARGWFLNDGESVPDVIAVAVPLVVHQTAFAIALAGPRHRMEGRIEERAEQVTAACRAILGSGIGR